MTTKINAAGEQQLQEVRDAVPKLYKDLAPDEKALRAHDAANVLRKTAFIKADPDLYYAARQILVHEQYEVRLWLAQDKAKQRKEDEQKCT